MPAAAIMAGTAIAGVYSAKKSGDAAEDALSAQESQAGFQNMIAKEQLDLAKEQWNMYKTDIMPLEKEAQELGVDAQKLAMERGGLDLEAYKNYYMPLQEQFVGEAAEGIEADPRRAASEARRGVDAAFDSAQGQQQRDLARRGVRPGSGAYDQDISLSRAATQAYAVNRAIEAERDRAEDVNFNRKATVLGRQPLATSPTQGPGSPGVSAGLATAGYGGAGRTAYGAGRQYGNIGATYGSAAAGAASGAVQLGMQAYDTYNKYKHPNTGFSPGGGYDYAAGGGYGTTAGSQQSTMLAEQNEGFYEGGPVNAPALGRTAYGTGGEVNGPPGVDQVPAYIEGPDGGRAPARLTDQEYVIPADVVRDVGTGPLDDIIQKSRERKQKASGMNALTRPGGR